MTYIIIFISIACYIFFGGDAKNNYCIKVYTD